MKSWVLCAWTILEDFETFLEFAYEYFKLSWLNYGLHVFIQERQVITGEREIHGLFLFGFEVDFLEASQGSRGRGGGADEVVYIQLDDFFSTDFSGVGYVYADADISRGGDLGTAQAQVGVLEGGVAESVAEIKQRGGLGEDVILSRLAGLPWSVPVTSGRGLMIVISANMAD